MAICKKCSVEFAPRKAYAKLCPTCEAHWVWCDVCQQIRPLDQYPILSYHEKDSEKIICCGHCARAGKVRICSQCHLCIPTEKETKTVVTAGGFGGSRTHILCPSCVAKVGICESCRDMFYLGDVPPDKDRRYCRTCHSEKKVKYLHINNAGLRPIPHFFGETGPYYGIELEVDDPTPRVPRFLRSECATELDKLITTTKGAFYMKSDGSLSNGFEIVSMPHSLEEWKTQEWLKTACETVKSYHGSSYNTNTCGLHVHRSRDDLSDLHLVILISLFVRLQPFFERIAQRKENGYCYYAFYKGTQKRNVLNLNGNVIYKAVKDKTGSILNRYQALNITCPATVECRIFKGTLCSSSVLAYISFMHWLCEFAKQKSTVLAKILKMSIPELWGTLSEFFTIDPLLTAYLQAKKVAIKGTKASDKMVASGMFAGEPTLEELEGMAEQIRATGPRRPRDDAEPVARPRWAIPVSWTVSGLNATTSSNENW